MFEEFEVVALTKRIPLDEIWDVPSYSPLREPDDSGGGLLPDDVGTIVHIYLGGEAFEVEFMLPDGYTAAQAVIAPSCLRRATERDLENDRFRKMRALVPVTA